MIYKTLQKTKDCAMRTSLKTDGELWYPVGEGSPFPTSYTGRVHIVINPMISHELGKGRIVPHLFFSLLSTYRDIYVFPSRVKVYVCKLKKYHKCIFTCVWHFDQNIL